MRKLIKKILSKLGLEEKTEKLYLKAILIYRHLVRSNKRLIKNYLKFTKIKKLHIGCGKNIITGWLNSDSYPKSNKVLYLDITKIFPFRNDEFDFIFSEHVIEHIDFQKGLFMLEECFRVLKHGGKIRVSTPDLQFLIDLYKKDKSELQKKYIKWATDTYIPSAPTYKDTFVINNFVRNWGHKFIYDEEILYMSLEKAGFTNIIKFPLNISEDNELCHLENETRMPEGFLRLETITLEGTKP